MPTISPSLNGFLKGLFLVVCFSIVTAVAAFLENATNIIALLGPTLGPIVAPVVGAFVTAEASALESYIKDQTGQGLFGAVRVNRTIPSGY